MGLANVLGWRVIQNPKPQGSVDQSDLEEYFLLRRERDAAIASFRALEGRIRASLEAGAPIEHGIHSARLVRNGRSSYVLVR